MRTLSFSLFLALCLHTAGGQTLPGYVTIQNSGKAAGKDKPLSAHPASVLAKGAATDADVRPEDGGFELFFDGKKPGQDVEIAVVKPGYEVVNHEDLVARLPDPASGTPAVRIYLCPQGEWRRYADQYYETNQRDLRDRYDRRIREAEQRLAAAGNAGRALADSVNRLIRERDEALVLLKGYAEQFARVNLDDVTERYRTAFRYFAAGKLDSFLLAANEKAIRADLARVEAEIKRAKALGKTGRDKVAAGEALRQQTLQELLIRARALALNSRWDEADRTLGMAAAEDSSNHATHLEYYRFKKERWKLPEALNIAERMLRLSKTVGDSLLWINCIGSAYMAMVQYDPALKYCEWELDMLKRNRNVVFMPSIAQANCLSIMARIWQNKGDYQKAERLADESLSMNERAVRIHKQVAQEIFPAQLLDLGDRYQEYANYSKAEAAYLRAWEMKRSAVDTTTTEYRDWNATVKGKLQSVYFLTNKQDKAFSMSQELVDYWAEQAKQDPLLYTAAYVAALKSLVSNLITFGKMDMADQYLILADSLLQDGQISPGNEILYGDILSLKIWNDLLNNRRNLALSGAEASITYYRNLLQRDSLVFGDKLAAAYTTFLGINSSSDRAEKNVTFYQEYLALVRSLQRMQPQKYTNPLAYALRTGASDWLPNSARKESLLVEAEGVYRKLASENPDKYASGLADCLLNMGLFAILNEDTTKAIACFEEALSINSEFLPNKGDIRGNPVMLLDNLHSLGVLNFKRNPVLADSFFMRAIGYTRKVPALQHLGEQQVKILLLFFHYGTFKANYGPMTDAIALLSETSLLFKKLPPEFYARNIFLFQWNQCLLGNMYLLDRQPEKALAAHRELVQEEYKSNISAKNIQTLIRTNRLFTQMDAGDTDSLVSGLEALLADTTFDNNFFPVFYHFGTYLLNADKLSKAISLFRKTNGYYKSLLALEIPYGKLHTQVMSALLSTETAHARALRYARTRTDTWRKEALDLLDAAEKMLHSVPENTPGRAMVAAKIAGQRAELKN